MKDHKVLQKLILKKYSISFAESMTGGMLAARLIGHKGASNVISQSYVTYSKEAKEDILKIDLKNDTIVSLKVAQKMALGLKQKHLDDVVVSITGNAGPTLLDGDTLKAYISIILKDKTYDYNLIFKSKRRKKNINQATRFIYQKLYEIL